MKFKAQLYLKTQEENGRRVPFFSGYSPKLSMNGKLYPCKVVLPKSVKMMTPGSSGQVEIEVDGVLLKAGTSFELVEGDHIVSTGSIT